MYSQYPLFQYKEVLFSWKKKNLRRYFTFIITNILHVLRSGYDMPSTFLFGLLRLILPLSYFVILNSSNGITYNRFLQLNATIDPFMLHLSSYSIH